MKPVNLYSISRLHGSGIKSKFNGLVNHLADIQNSNMKVQEIDSLNSFVSYIFAEETYLFRLEKYYIGFTIPQIGKEFDLLRIAESYILNIELKSEENLEDIFEQLIKNKYYLSHLGRAIYLYTYVSKTNKLYKLSMDGSRLQESNRDELVSIIDSMQGLYCDEISKLFKVSNFLVSPLNNPEKFIEGKYFLTLQQKEIKDEINKHIKNGKSKAKFFAISGNPGTGKTLLTYDIAKECAKGANTLIIHCGLLSGGHHFLNEHIRNLTIRAASDTFNIDLQIYKYIFIDETQRNFPNQFDYIVEYAKSNNLVLFISYDPRQVLSKKERMYDIKRKIETIPEIIIYELSNKIRTNETMANFIKALFDLGKKNAIKTKADVEVLYANHYAEAALLINFYRAKEYKFVHYTKSNRFSREIDVFIEDINTHRVIGQEFDDIVMVIDDNFYYSSDNLLSSIEHPNPNYIYDKLLYQGITRVREKLCLIIIKNVEMFEVIRKLANCEIE